jgi:hypothetical protein
MTYSVTLLPISPIRNTVHYVASGVFLGCLSIMSLFLFTKSNKPVNNRGQRKIIRNAIYRICGILMLVAIGVMFFGGYLEWIPPTLYADNHLTFWMETLAVESFGFSWLVKGETLFGDINDLVADQNN